MSGPPPSLRNGRDGVSEEARETASSSPAAPRGRTHCGLSAPRAVGRPIPPPARGGARRRGGGRRHARRRGARRPARAHLLHALRARALAALARLRAAAHQLIADAAAAYNVLAPLLRGGIMPPPGLEPVTSGGDPPPEALACEWRAVSRRAAAGGGRATRSSTRSLTKTGGGRKRARFSLPPKRLPKAMDRKRKIPGGRTSRERDPRDGPSRRGRGVSRRRRETRPDARRPSALRARRQ